MADRNARPIRGRADELKLISTLVASLRQGRGGILVIEGPPGIGKSRLAMELINIAEKSDVRALFGQAFEYQRAVPFYSLFTATLHADPPVGDAEELRRLGNSADLHYWVVHGLDAAIHTAAREKPLTIVLEDIHWADTSSLVALRALTATRYESPVLWVVSARTGAGGPATQDTLTELDRRGAQFIRLTALPRSGMIDMVEDTVRARADVSVVNLADKAHGNPFLLTELLGGLQEEGRLEVTRGCAVATGDFLPQRLSATMQQRLDALSEGSREVIQVAAVLPDRFTAVVLAHMLERQPAALVSAIDEAVRADLLVEDGDHLKFRHDLLRDAARQSLPQTLRRAMERQAATVMLEVGAAPEEVATQLVRSADVGDQAAIAALRQAAQSVAKSDKSGAADLSRRALELLPADDAQRGAVLAETVGLLHFSGRYQEADDLAVAMLSELPPEGEAQTRLRVMKAADGLDERVAENRRALQLSRIDDATRARHHAWLACNHAVSGLSYDRSFISQALASADATKDPESQLICEITLAIMDYVDGFALRALERLNKVDFHTDGHDPSFTSTLAGIHQTNALTYIGRSDEAAVIIDEGLKSARGEGGEVALALWALQRAANQLAVGDICTARASLESVAPSLWGTMSEISMNRWLILTEVAAHTGDQNLLHDATIHARSADPGGITMVNRGAAYVLALAAWLCGDTHEAARWLSCDSGHVLNPMWNNCFDQFIFTARVAVAAGDAGLRARVLQSLHLLEHDSEAIPVFAAMILHTRGILERDVHALTDAAAALRGARPLLSAAAAEDAGTEFARRGANLPAIEKLNEAFDAYAKCGASADARRVARRLRSLGVERRIVQSREKVGWDSLTDAELKVVNLIAGGATNSTVAEQLHLSPNTVKSHLRNAFAKLGINSRSQLAELTTAT